MSGVAASGGRARALIALVIAYAVALQLLLPTYAFAVAGPTSGVICAAGYAGSGNGSQQSGKVHCAQCGWDSSAAPLPAPPAAVVRDAIALTADLPILSGVTVATLVGPRLSQGPPRADF
jgi:hypothetical protein